MRLRIRTQMTLVLITIALLFVSSSAVVRMLNSRVETTAEIVTNEVVPTAINSLAALDVVSALNFNLLEYLSGEEEEKLEFQQNLKELRTFITALDESGQAEDLNELTDIYHNRAQKEVFERFDPAKERWALDRVNTLINTVGDPLEKLLDELKESEINDAGRKPDLDEVLNDDLPGIRYYLELVDEAGDMVNDLNEYLSKDAEEARKSFMANALDFKKFLEELRPLEQRPAEKEALNRVDLLFTTLYTGGNDIFSTYDPMQKRAALQAVDNLEHEVVHKLERTLKKMSDRAKTLSDEETGKLLLTTRRNQAIIVTVVLFSILLMIGIIYFLYRTVFQPMNDINHSMITLAGGNVDAEIFHLDRKDELGDMARAVQQFKEVSMLRNNAEKELLNQKQKAETATRYKSDFLANMSHEIRTPMNAIIGLLTLVQKTDLDSRQRSYLHKMDLASQNLLGILNDILDFSKIEAGKLVLESIDFNLNDVLQTLSTYLLEKNREKELDLIYNIDPKVPFKLKGDPLRLGQILLNLGSNAIKFTQEGEVVLSISVLQYREREVTLSFELRDTGIGMSQAAQNRILQPFMQADISTTRKYGGTGLGLSITRQLITLMGGELQLESEIQVGTTFRFTLNFPYSKESNDQFNAQHTKAKGTQVILGDSNETSRSNAIDILQSLGIKVVAAEEGEEVIKLFETFKESPEELITILDYNLKNRGCLETAEMLKRAPQEGKKLIFTTSVSKSNLLDQMSEVNPSGILMKPYSKSTLFDTLADALGKGQILSAVRDSHKTGNELSGTTILVAEDNETNREVIDELLTDLGCEVILAKDGAEAVATVRRIHNKLDLVFMDIQMPTMDGITATQKIRTELRLHKLPIIALTAHAIETQKQACLNAGMNDHVSKPINQRELIAAIEKWRKPSQSTTPTQAAPVTADSTALPSDEELPLLNPTEGIDRFGGKESIYRKTLSSFCMSFGTNREKVSSAIGEKTDSIAKVIHNLKGVAGTLAATRLHQHCISTEKLCKKSDQPALAEALEELLILMDETKVAMDTYLGAQVTSELPQTTPNASFDDHINFSTLLANNDASAIPQFESLKPFYKANLSAENYALLQMQMGQLNFQKALAILKEFSAEPKDNH